MQIQSILLIALAGAVLPIVAIWILAYLPSIREKLLKTKQPLLTVKEKLKQTSGNGQLVIFSIVSFLIAAYGSMPLIVLISLIFDSRVAMAALNLDLLFSLRALLAVVFIPISIKCGFVLSNKFIARMETKDGE